MVKVALMWHMHQPWYASPFSDKFELPWVRIHAIKDYYGMAKLVSEFPDIGVTFNLVPSLLQQIELYIDGKKDHFQEIFEIPVADMSDGQVIFLVNNFFSVNYDKHIKPFPRYDMLYKKMKENGGKDFTGNWREIFSDEELTDLQTWFSLTNIDQYYRDNDKRVKKLIRKGEGFSEENKRELSSIEMEIMKKVIPLYKEMWKNGNIEISTTPFYHPILPLLIDPGLGRVADPGLPEYDLDFNWKEDAVEQIEKGLEYMEALFGMRPSGMWPSEGSLSEEVIGILEDKKIEWTATDEKIVERSLKEMGVGSEERKDAKFSPWTFRGGDLKVFFRDNYLSDLIGFHYKNWDQKTAANDLFNKISVLGHRDNGDIILPVILDGENAWEFYDGSGRDFLREFYSLIGKSDVVEMITFSEAALSRPGDMTKFSPGSWINGNFNIWIGHEDDRKGWELIRKVRELVDLNKKNILEKDIEGIRENIKIAQGSDWFWWYGSENHTDDIEIFDRLFRENLVKACVEAGVEVTPELEVPVFGTRKKMEMIKKGPDRYLIPVIDGNVTSVYEWFGSGEIETGNLASAIYISHPVFRKINYCFDRENLYFALNLKKNAVSYPDEGFSFELEIENEDVRSTLYLEQGGLEPKCVFGSIIECRIPFNIFNGAEGKEIRIRFFVKKRSEASSPFPNASPLCIMIPTERDYAKNWTL